VSSNGNNALCWATLREGNAPTVEQLIEMGFDANFVNNKLKTPLILAADFGDTEIVKSLVNMGANPAAQGLMRISFPLFELLLTVLPAIADKKGHTALWYASNRGNKNIASILLSHPAVSQFVNLKSLEHNTTPLFEVVWRNFTPMVPLFLACPRTQSCYMGHSLYLINSNQNADTNVNEPRRSSDGRLHTPLHQALHSKNDVIATWLIDDPRIDIHGTSANRYL